MVGVQPALVEQLFDISQRERASQVPADGAENQDRLWLPPFEDRWSGCHFGVPSGYQSPTPATCNTSVCPIAWSNLDPSYDAPRARRQGNSRGTDPAEPARGLAGRRCALHRLSVGRNRVGHLGPVKDVGELGADVEGHSFADTEGP